MQCVPQKKGTLPHEVHCECAYCASSPAVFEMDEAHSPPKIQPSESTPSDAKQPALERHNYEEGHTNAEKQSKYRYPKRQRIEVLFLLLILVACDAGA